MTVLSGPEIRRRVFQTEGSDQRLVITPLLDPEEQMRVGQSSVDRRLGNVFVIQRRSEIARLDPWEPTEGDELFIEEEIYVPFGRPFILPNQFVLGCTLECLGLPPDLSAYVTTRSGWGRVGLIVATAIGIHPGYRGVITLELRNLAEVPVYIYPGTPICQAFFHSLSSVAEVDSGQGSFRMSTRPEFANVRLAPRDKEALESLGKRLGVDHIRPRVRR